VPAHGDAHDDYPFTKLHMVVYTNMAPMTKFGAKNKESTKAVNGTT